jgi:hypothetical protein
MRWTEALHEHQARLRRQVEATARAVRQAQAQTEQAMAALGLKPPGPDAPVIDVEAPGGGLVKGAIRGLARNALRGALLLATLVLLGAALWSLGIFIGASLLAFVVVTRGLGLRIDLSTPRPA